MKRLIVLVCVCALLVLAPAASADVLTFDDVTTGSFGPIPDGYGGLDWDQFYVLDPVAVGYLKDGFTSGYHNGLVSGDYVAFNVSAHVATASDGGFNFLGAYLTGAWTDDLNVTVTGYDDGVQTYQQTVVADYYLPTWFQFNFLGVDEVTFASYGGRHVSGSYAFGEEFAMDNFTYSIPEPSSLSLLALGLAGVALS